LLKELNGLEGANRAAQFVSAVAIAKSDGTMENISIGICKGRIARAPRGVGGFGYDPIFIPEGFDVTFAELSNEVKNRISHRTRALAQATAYLA
jgi:XTP/dITP diphosphohydrolase